MKKKKILVYDIFIYTTLILAISILALGGLSYFYSLQEKSNLKNELNGAIKELKGEEEVIQIKETEPDLMKEVNKEIIIEDYLNKVYDQTIKDDIITDDIIKTWEKYEVINVKYNRNISDNYYSYIVDIKIANLKAKLPTTKNLNLSTDEYIVVSLCANISHSIENNTYSVKSFNIPIEK